MKIDDQNEIINRSRMKKEWREPQLAQLNVKETKNGQWTATFEGNLFTKHGNGVPQPSN